MVNDRYCTQNVIQMIKSRASEIDGACSTCGGGGSGMPGFGRETEEKGLLGTPRP
jgi:hypothetical protein